MTWTCPCYLQLHFNFSTLVRSEPHYSAIPALTTHRSDIKQHLILAEHRATHSVITDLAVVLDRHRGETEVRMKLTKGDVAKVFEVPHPVKVTADLYGELKSLLGPGCLG